MKSLTKYLLLLIVIFPVIILLSSVFAEKATGQNLPSCGQNLTCSASKVNGQCSSTQTKCLSDTDFWGADQVRDNNNVWKFIVCCNNPTSVPTSTSIPPTPTSAQITPPTCFDDCMALVGKTEASCSKQCGLPVPAPAACNYNNSPDGCSNNTSLWCLDGTCTSCSTGFLNCDQTQGCETSGNSCLTPTPIPSTPTSTPAPTTRLVWTQIAVCSAPTSPPAASTTPGPASCDPALEICTTPNPTIPTVTAIPTSSIPIPSATPTNTPTPTPDFKTSCSSKNSGFTPNWDAGCFSSRCPDPWFESALGNLDCDTGNKCCVKAPFTLITTSPTGGPSPGVSSGNTALAISLELEGISIEKGANNIPKGNPDPKTKTRPTTIELFNDQNQRVAIKTIQPIYNLTTGIFTDTANLGAFPSGNYLVKIQSERYLKRLLPGIINIKSGQTNPVPALTLLAGDVNGDNELNILDYTIFTDCFGVKATSTSCKNKTSADVNDDGVVDGVDYNLFIHSLAIRKGD